MKKAMLKIKQLFNQQKKHMCLNKGRQISGFNVVNSLHPDKKKSSQIIWFFIIM